MSFSIKEIIDIAVGVEETGYAFYREASGKFKDPALTDMFEFLAKEELAHKELFQSMGTGREDGGVFNEEYFSYLKAIGGQRVFDRDSLDTKKVVEKIATPMGAIQYAFNAEKDSILLYSEMKGLYREGSGSISILDRIIAEERKHIAVLIDLSEKLRLAGAV